MAHLVYCRCGYEYRCDEPGPRRTCCFDDDDHHFCRRCPNVDCREGPIAADLKKRLRASPCETCKNEGLIRNVMGDPYFCPDECEAGRLLQREQDAFLRFVPE